MSTDACVPEKQQAEFTEMIELMPVRGGAPPGLELPSNEPAKVQLFLPTAEQETGAFDQLPQKVFAEQASLAIENKQLAFENARLAWENNMLQHHQHHQHMGRQGWWSPMEWGQPMDPWASLQATMQPGMPVVFEGLKSSVELNGQQAIIERWDEDSGRWVVRLASGEDKFAKPQNLLPAYGWPMYPSMPYTGNFGAYPEQPPYRGARTKRVSSSNSIGKPGSHSSSFSSIDSTATGNRSAVSSFTSEECNADSAEESSPKTTVMMRNIPNDYTREMLLQLINTQGFSGAYDLVYLPIDYTSKVGFGYAFINLISPQEAERFRSHFEGFASWDVVSQKVCEVCWSSVLQGVQAHIDRYRNSPVMHEAVPDEFKPALFVHGDRVPFPAPTKSIRAPRARRKDSK